MFSFKKVAGKLLIGILLFTAALPVITITANAEIWYEPINYMWENEHQCNGNCLYWLDHKKSYEVKINDVKSNLKVYLQGHQINLTCKDEKGHSYLFKVKSKYYDGWSNSNGISLIHDQDSIDAMISLERGTYTFTVEGKDKSSKNIDYNFNLHIEEMQDYATEVSAQKKMTLDVGERQKIDYTVSPKDASVRMEFLSSDESVFTVSPKGTVTAVHTGTADLIMTLPNGTQEICTVNVIGKVVNVKSQYGICYDNKITLRFEPVSDAISYKIYRSDQKDGKYSAIKEVTPDDLAGKKVLMYADKSVKADKRYYYKVSVKTNNESNYAALSDAVSYWTAPKRHTGKLSGHTVSWKKVKGADGYWVEGISEIPHYKWGYYIWTSCSSFVEITKKTTLSATTSDGVLSDVYVYPYAKHGKKYYAHGKKVTKSMYTNWKYLGYL